MKKTLDLQELSDREQIKELRNQFALALDNKDWPLLASLLSDEVEADYSVWGIPKARLKKLQLVDLLKHAFRRPEMQTQHIYSNFLIEISGDQANCISNFIGQHFIDGFEGGNEFVLRASYTDQLVRGPSGWKIQGLKLKVFYATGNAKIVG